MSKIVFIVEKTADGFSAYAEDDNIRAATSGDTMSELRINIVDAYNSFAEIKGLPELTIDDINVQLDLPQFFEYYNVINASALAARIGMDKTLLSQYVNGHKIAGHKQVTRILQGIKSLGSELSSLELV